MNTITVRLQLEDQEFAKANKLAKVWDFSSAEEALSEFMKRFLSGANKAEAITLSKKAKARYKKMGEDFRVGKNMQIAESAELLKHKRCILTYCVSFPIFFAVRSM